MRKNFLFTLCAFVAFGFVACTKSTANEEKPLPKPEEVKPVNLKLDTLLTGLDQPWGMAFLPDGGLLIAEKRGVMSLYKNNTRVAVTGMPTVRSTGQGGLMDIALHPDFKNNNYIYFTATTDTANGFSTALYRAVINGNALSGVQKIFQSNQINTSGVHFGSRIVFDKMGKLYVCLGERNQTTLAQSLSSHAGKVVRLNDDGSIPLDNPYYNTAGALKDIYTYGHRNPQGMVMHPVTGNIWLHEHGPMGGDEINLLQTGANYAWPLATFGINYNGTPVSKDTALEATLQPIHYWVPSIAPCGMDFYFSDSIPQWKGKLFIGALVARHLNVITLSGNKVTKEERLLQGFARFRCVKAGNDGYLYFLTESPGLLCRYRPEN